MGKTERENKERSILIEGGIMGLVRNLTLGKCPEIHKDDSSYDSKISTGERF